MQNKTVIILLSPGKEPICRGSLSRLCYEFKFPYYTLVKLDFPIQYKEFTIYKVPFNK
jgi:hypothetical protein